MNKEVIEKLLLSSAEGDRLLGIEYLKKLPKKEIQFFFDQNSKNNSSGFSYLERSLERTTMEPGYIIIGRDALIQAYTHTLFYVFDVKETILKKWGWKKLE